MQEFIYKEDGKYFCEMVDMVGITFLKEEIKEEEYNNYKRGVNDG